MAVVGIPFVFPGVLGVRCLFQTPCMYKVAGCYPWDLGSHIAIDMDKQCVGRQELLKQGNFTELVEVDQVHGDDIIFDPLPTFYDSTIDSSLIQQADGISTTQKGLGLLIKTADCQPILFVHKSGQYIAAIHVGWRGNRIQFPQTAVKIFCEQYALSPSEIFVVRGPSLSREYAQFTQFDEEWGAMFQPWFSTKTQTMDLWKLTQAQLMEAGIPVENIFAIDLCTYSMPELFFSYRRNTFCGRQGSLIWIEK